MTRLVLTTPPAVEPLTAADVRLRLNLPADIGDAAIEPLIKAARQQIDGWTGWLGRSLITQTWTIYLPSFAATIRIPLPPIQSIVSVKYLDEAGNEQTVDGVNYKLVLGAPALLKPALGYTWPAAQCSGDAVRIAFKAGYGDAGTDVPEPIRSAIALMVSQLRSLTERNLFISQDSVEGVGSKQYVVGGNAGLAITGAVDALLSTYRVWSL